MDPDVVTDIISKLNDRYNKLKPLTKTRGKLHTYLGTTLDYTQPGKVVIDMQDYVQEVLDGSRHDMSGGHSHITGSPTSIQCGQGISYRPRDIT